MSHNITTYIYIQTEFDVDNKFQIPTHYILIIKAGILMHFALFSESSYARLLFYNMGTYMYL